MKMDQRTVSLQTSQQLELRSMVRDIFFSFIIKLNKEKVIKNNDVLSEKYVFLKFGESQDLILELTWNDSV